MSWKFFFGFGMVVILSLADSVSAVQVVVQANRDLGLYSIIGAPVAAPGVAGTQRGSGGRFDVNGTALDGVAGGPNEGVLLGFNVAGIVPAGHYIQSAVLNVYKPSTGGFGWDVDVAAYPLIDTWQEGVGTAGGLAGSTGFPWGDASVGDSVKSLRVVDSVVQGEGSFAFYKVAATGTPWAVPGARGIGTDVHDLKMISSRQTGSDDGDPPGGSLLESMDLTLTGLDVITSWADGSLVNNGMSLWFEVDHGDPREGGSFGDASTWRVASREWSPALGEVPPGGGSPELVLQIVPVPEPTSLLLLAMGILGFIARRSR